MSASRGIARVTRAAAVLTGVAGLLACGACGAGDDNASPVPLPDGAVTTGAASTGTADAAVCIDGSANGGDTTANPYTVCSPFTGGCIRFDPIRVPPHPTL
jgi:hypothetical protein